MRILYFHQHFTGPDGASGLRSYQMAKRLVDRGHQVTMVCGRHASGKTGLEGPFVKGVRQGRVDGIDVIEIDLPYSNRDRFLRRSLIFARFVLRAIGLALRERYDLVFATTTPLTVGLPGIFARWIRGKPFVFEVRDLWPELPRAMGVIRNPLLLGAMSLLEFASYRSAHRVIGLSPGIAEGIARRGVAKSRIDLVPNGCDLDIFAHDARPWRPADVRDDDLLAVFSGTHGIANGLDAVLDAAAELRRRGRGGIKLLLVGDGMLKPGLEERARREQLDNVIFLAPVPKSKLAGLLASADLGLQILANVPAFYYGTSPNKFFDYLAAGLPVLNNYPGWLADLIRETGCGFALPPDDPVAFADALQQAAADRKALKDMGGKASELGRRQFDRNLLADRWIAAVEQTHREAQR